VNNNPINYADALGLWGFGVTGGGSVAGGSLGLIGPVQGMFGGTVSVGAGYFSGGGDNTAFGSYGDLGVFASGGAFSGTPSILGGGIDKVPNYDQNPGALGLYGDGANSLGRF